MTDSDLIRIRNRFALYEKSGFFYGARTPDAAALLETIRELRREVAYWKQEALQANNRISRVPEHFRTRHNLTIPPCQFLAPSFGHPDDLDWKDPVFSESYHSE